MHLQLMGVCVCACMLSCVSVFVNPWKCSLPSSSIHGISQARILEWLAICYSRGSSQPRGQSCVSGISHTGRQILYHCNSSRFIEGLFPVAKIWKQLMSLSMDEWIKKMWHNCIIEYSSSVTQPCLTFCDPTDCSRPGLTVHHQVPELAQTRGHWVHDAIQSSYPLFSPSAPSFNLSQHQVFSMSPFFASGGQSIGVSASASIIQWIFRTDLF